MSDYYDHGSAPADNSFGDPAVIRAEFDLIAQNISGKLPSLAANGDKILAVNTGATALVALTTTGTGSAVRATSPTLVTPALGTPSSGVATNLTGLPLSSGVTGTLPVANGGTGVTTSTGTGNVVLSASPTLVTPALGTPSSGVATNLTGLPLTTGVTGVLPVANGGTGATSSGAALTALGAAASGANNDITSLTGLTTGLAATSNLGLLGTNTPATPTTKFDLSATSAVLRNAAGNTIAIHGITTKTCDFGLAGPAANGRDQAAVFSASQWVQLFWIYNPTTVTVALIASLNAATSAPTALPSGYTYYAYATSVRWDGSSNILRTYVRGQFASYATQQVALTGGVAIAETTVNVATFVPPGATRYQINAVYANGASAQSGFLKLATGVTFTATDVGASVTTPRDITLPNVGQALIYVQSAATLVLGIGVMGYYVSNGDS